jgi:hypothetical protein
MSNMNRFRTPPGSADCEFNRLMDAIREILCDGIRHGFFNAEISVSIPRADRREVVISAGKSHKYTIKTDDLPR